MSLAVLDKPRAQRPECDGCIEPTPATWRYVGDRAAPTNLCAPHKELWQGAVDGNPANYLPYEDDES